MSQSDDEALDEDISQQLSPTNDSQKVLGRPTDKKNHPNPMSLEKLGDAYNNVDSISELTRFLWKRVEEHEVVNDMFKHKRDMYA